MAKKLWGGRFKKKIDKDFENFSKSISYDYKLAEYDILHSMVHIRALNNAGILNEKEIEKLDKALDELYLKAQKGEIKSQGAEDIHTEIQNRIEKSHPQLALKMHALRSRNDQVVFDEQFYCIEKCLNIRKKILDLLESLFFIVKKCKGEKFIGYTHTQRAQAIKFDDYLFAFFAMLERDANRLKKFQDDLSVFIGAGALTGSALTRQAYTEAINKLKVAGDWKRIKPAENTLDNVSDREQKSLI